MRDTPALHAPPLADPLPRPMCTDCGLSRMALAPRCGTACQFTVPDFPALEAATHGLPPETDDWFGPRRAMHRARMDPPRPGAQWTGITTALAAKLLETGAATAVLTLAPHEDDPFRPVPVIVTEARGMEAVRGMRMGYAPLLALLEPAVAQGHRRIAVIGIPCQVHALRRIETDLGLERLWVIGTPCSDNTTTENFHAFLARLTDRPEDVTYLEFRADYRVEMRLGEETRLIPFLQLPLSDLPDDFFPLTCRTCTDYANRLADVTVGYMAGDGDQWLIVRNGRGAEMVAMLDDLRLAPLTSKGKREGAVRGFVANTERAAGGLPLRRMPGWLRPLVAWLQPRVGPRGLEFARARLEMKAAETILHLRRHAPKRMRHMIPDHVWRLAAPYGLRPEPGERDASTSPQSKAP